MSFGKTTLAILALAGSLFIAPRSLPGEDTAPSSCPRSALMPDTSGEIAEIILHFTKDLAEEILPTFEALLGQLEWDTVIYVHCDSCGAAEIFLRAFVQWDFRYPERLKVCVGEDRMTVWARDRYVAMRPLKSPARRIVLIPSLRSCETPDRLNDSTVPETISNTFNVRVDIRESEFFFEGGNIVSSVRHLFTGYSTLASAKRIHGSDGLKMLEREFGKIPIIVGSEEWGEDEGHIDMFLTPLGDSTVVLGDPALGADLLYGVVERKPDRDSRISTAIAAPSVPVCDWMGVRSKALLARYALIRSQLLAQGFKVERIPIVHPVQGPVITYNNALMEVRRGRRIVYMPHYGLQALDEAARSRYEALGFRVKPVDVSEIYKFGGTLRCITNVLSRRGVKSLSGGRKPWGKRRSVLRSEDKK